MVGGWIMNLVTFTQAMKVKAEKKKDRHWRHKSPKATKCTSIKCTAAQPANSVVQCQLILLLITIKIKQKKSLWWRCFCRFQSPSFRGIEDLPLPKAEFLVFSFVCVSRFCYSSRCCFHSFPLCMRSHPVSHTPVTHACTHHSSILSHTQHALLDSWPRPPPWETGWGDAPSRASDWRRWTWLLSTESRHSYTMGPFTQTSDSVADWRTGRPLRSEDRRIVIWFILRLFFVVFFCGWWFCVASKFSWLFRMSSVLPNLTSRMCRRWK